MEKNSSIERVKSNVDKEVGDRIREYGYAGVKVDEDFKRYYPFGELLPKSWDLQEGITRGLLAWKFSTRRC